MRPTRYFHWERFQARPGRRSVTADPLRRMRMIFAGFVVLLLIVFGRLVQLEATQGAAFRAEAAKPLEREYSLPGIRGRILAGSAVLACDKEASALAVQYRWLEEPADPDWLRRMVRLRLTRDERRDKRRVAEAKAAVLAERSALAQRVSLLTGISAEQWTERARRIQTRVEHIRESVNRRRKQAYEAERTSSGELGGSSGSFWTRMREAVLEILQSSGEPDEFVPIRVAEQYDYHVMIDDVPLEAVAAIEGNPSEYPAVRLVARQSRTYPQGPLLAHALGFLGAVEPDELKSDEGYHPEDWIGRAGLEQAYEHALRGKPGTSVERTDRSGRILSTHVSREPTVGRDLLVTIDVELQRTAESLLEQALQRREIRMPDAKAGGGAIVVLDARTGAVLAMASAPTFDPNIFGGSNPKAVQSLLEAQANPLFNRSIQMAIPPGSVFKVATAAALLQEGAVRPGESMHCQGYLRTPEELRCAIFRSRGVGHGNVTLSDALCASCNVYFLHHAGRLGWTPIADWAWRLGLGRPSGIDLAQEAAGGLPLPRPMPEDGIDRTAELPSIGQGEVTATPIQVARMMAAVANGGKLVTPHLVRGYGLPLSDDGSPHAETTADQDLVNIQPPEPIEGLSPAVLDAIRAGLLRTVVDPAGTAYDGDASPSLTWAGKTGTAETGIDDQEHAWFAGYAPADKPRVAFVVVLEHAGNASESAVPVAKRLATWMAGQRSH